MIVSDLLGWLHISSSVRMDVAASRYTCDTFSPSFLTPKAKMTRGKHERKRQNVSKKAKERGPRVVVLKSQQVAENYSPTETNSPNDATQNGGQMWVQRYWEWVKRSSSFTDWCIAAFTLALALVAIYQYLVTSHQLGVMRNDERAWLKFDSDGDPNSSAVNGTSFTINSGQPLAVPFRITNIGKTPALKAEAGIVIEIVPAGQEPNLPTPKQEIALPGHPAPKLPFLRTIAVQGWKSSIIFPTEVRKQAASRKRVANGGIEDENLTAQEANDLAAGRAYLLVWGEIWYEDVFNRKHWTRFCTVPYIGTFRGNFEKCADFGAVDAD